MTKTDLIDAIAAKVGKPKTEVGETVDAIVDTITQKMVEGEDVNITGFGIFKASHRKARQGVNPRTGEKIQIEARNVPKFRPSKTLKDAVK